jgi:choline-sulfatase
MHFVGPDQLHGFEERLTTDIYPADFGWTPDYRKPGERIDWWYHNLGSVTGAGVAEITNQMEYDDEVVFLATQKLYQLRANVSDDANHRPWCLTVSLSHPHDPYVARKQYWDLYEHCPALEPETGFIAIRRAGYAFAAAVPRQRLPVSRSRRAGASFAARLFRQHLLCRRQGRRILDVLERTRMLDDTIILFCSDHGDMLGERGLWFKMSFFEGSARVPLMIAGKGVRAGLIEAPVSNLDVAPDALRPRRHRHRRDHAVDRRPVAAAAHAEGIAAHRACADGICGGRLQRAARGIRDGRYKFVHCEIDPPQLFDLEADPLERDNLADDPANARPGGGSSWTRSRRAGTWPASTPPCAKARRAAGSSIRRCATAPIIPGISSRCKKRPSVTCAIT